MRAPSEWVPLFSAPHVGDSRLDLAIEAASLEVSVSAFREKWSQAVARLALHALVMSDRATAAGTDGTGGTGAVASEAAGGLSISYATPGGSWSSSEADLGQTIHGLAFIRLRDSSTGFPEVYR